MGQLHYDTMSTVIEALRQEVYTVDFRLEENRLVYPSDRFKADEFDIMHVYRYEGDTDPGDEASVYAIESKSGLKGILVTGRCASSEALTTNLLKNSGGGILVAYKHQ